MRSLLRLRSISLRCESVDLHFRIMEACGSPFFCFVPDVWRFPGYFSSGVVVCPGFVALSRTFSFCGYGLSWMCGASWDIFLLGWWFVPVLWRFPGHILSADTVCPGCMAFLGIFFFRGGGLSRFCGVSQDIFLLLRWFVLVLWRFPGHFLSAETVCPGCMAFPGTFSFWGGGLSWMYGAFRDISLLLRWFVPVLVSK